MFRFRVPKTFNYSWRYGTFVQGGRKKKSDNPFVKIIEHINQHMNVTKS